MKQIAARCLLCGKTYDVEEDHKDFKTSEAKEVLFLSVIL